MQQVRTQQPPMEHRMDPGNSNRGTEIISFTSHPKSHLLPTANWGRPTWHENTGGRNRGARKSNNPYQKNQGGYALKNAGQNLRETKMAPDFWRWLVQEGGIGWLAFLE